MLKPSTVVLFFFFSILLHLAIFEIKFALIYVKACILRKKKTNSDSKRLLKSKIRHLEQILGKTCHLTFSGALYLVQKVQGHLLIDGF